MRLLFGLITALLFVATVPSEPMPDDLRRYAEQREQERIDDRAREWMHEGRALVSCQQFTGDVSKITICKTSRDDFSGIILYWIHKDDGQVWSDLKIGDFVFRDNLCKHAQRSMNDPRKIQKRIKELEASK